MAHTIAELRVLINADLDSKAEILGEEEELTTSQMDTVSFGVDAKNETWNPNLPTRPSNP